MSRRVKGLHHYYYVLSMVAEVRFFQFLASSTFVKSRLLPPLLVLDTEVRIDDLPAILHHFEDSWSDFRTKSTYHSYDGAECPNINLDEQYAKWLEQENYYKLWERTAPIWFRSKRADSQARNSRSRPERRWKY
jgi:hypothetical protein